MIHQFFRQKVFKVDKETDLENSAELALHLVLYFLSTQDPHNGNWPSTHVGTTLRNTCHILEALYLFGLEASTGALEAGIAWLVNLPTISTIEAEGDAAIRLYPSRFKTLAWLNEFSESHLERDFEDLEDHQDTDGVLRGIIVNPFLATMIYVDCVDHLAKAGMLSVLSQERRELSLDHIDQMVRSWYDSMQHNSEWTSVNNVGDLSYAIDLLIRAQRVSRDHKISQAVMQALITHLEDSENFDPITSDTLYCGIQLATHFNDVPRANRTVCHFISHLRIKYEKVNFSRDSIFLHPLVLRLMFAYHGIQLKTEITRLMLEHERQNLELRLQNREKDLKDDFRRLIKKRFQVEISDVQPLTGGFTEAEVFRVHFSFNFSSVSEDNERYRPYTFQPNPSSLVIKRGSLDSLRRSMREYRRLSDAIKPYFAKYASEPQVLEANPRAPGYLIMEDLTYMNTFQDILAHIDQSRLSSLQRENLQKVCTTICRGLFAIYQHTKRDESDFFGPQLSRLYISEMERNLIRMCRSTGGFPHLKSWLRGFWLGQRKYRSIEHYLRKIESHKAKLKIPYLMLTHGDCHSRNIMLDQHLRQVCLIDLDHFDNDGDYIKDLALLIEDICVFRFMFDEGYRLYLGNGSSRVLTRSTKPKVIENRIEYPPFSSEAVCLFQRQMLHHLEEFAETIRDESWKERLWLALAAYLLFLVVKQKDKDYATVVYVEAVKLLDDLVECLDNNVPLGEIPFPGVHPDGVVTKRGENGLKSPTWYSSSRLLAQIHDNLLNLNPTVKYELNSSGQVVQYFSAKSPHPFVVIDGKKQPPSVLLACTPEDLDDPAGLAQVRETGSPLKATVYISEENEAATILFLIQQVFKLET